MNWNIITGNALTALKEVPDNSIHAAVTSPPYWPQLRDYGGPQTEWPSGWVGCLGDEPHPLQFAQNLCSIFAEVKRVLRPDGTFWVNIGDSYAKDNKLAGDGIKEGDVLGVPWLLATEMRRQGWYLRSSCIWYKPDAFPRSAQDRCSEDHEYIFMFSKSRDYYFDKEAIRVEEDGKSHYHRTVWRIAASNFKGSHVATFPEKLAATCIKAGTSEGGYCGNCGAPHVRVVEKTRVPTRPAKKNKVDETKKACRDPLRHITIVKTVGWKQSCECIGSPVEPATVLDPFSGAATTGVAALNLGRRYLGTELFPEYVRISSDRLVACQQKLNEPVKSAKQKNKRS
jgi:site-specific DNA-methyltransferase (cytosine-N4-specific)